MSASTIALPAGLRMPRLGQGTWRMGEDRASRGDEVAALRLGLDLGMALIDTAEMYADAESVVGEAIRGRRDDVFVVSKVLPEHASFAGTVAACERSLRKLGVDAIDLYLLHWESAHPFEVTLAAFEKLAEAGKIRSFGVSNFDVDRLSRARACAGGGALAANQILYNLARRGPEARLIPACRGAGVAVMAYSPLEQGRISFGGALAAVANGLGATPAQVAIAWTLRLDGVVSIPKATRPEHVRENAGALDVVLGADELAALDRAHPRRGSALEWL